MGNFAAVAFATLIAPLVVFLWLRVRKKQPFSRKEAVVWAVVGLAMGLFYTFLR